MTQTHTVQKSDYPVGISGMVVTLLLMLFGLYRTFTIPMPDRDFRDLEAYRLVFIHVPFAWVGCLAFLVAAWWALVFLARRRPMDDRRACAAAELGLVFVVAATVTGMIFAKTQWGMAWNWDPRQTSIFFVLLLYAAYLVLRQALGDNEGLQGRISAAYLLLAVVPMLWLIGVYPRMQPGSLHPKEAPLNAEHWQAMLVNLLAMLGLFIIMFRQHRGLARVSLAARERWL